MSKKRFSSWKVLPLEGKYYGTRVQVGDDGEYIEVWVPDHFAEPFASAREIAKGWEPADGHDHVEDSQSYAIACLIAAAPELLEALKEAVCALEVCGKDFRATELARAAIAKATGELQP